MKRINRLGGVGKNAFEKEAYKNFLRSRTELDKTAEEKEDFDKTDSSNIHNEDTKEPKPIKKSFKLTIEDFFNGKLYLVILGPFLVLLLWYLVSTAIEISISQGIQSDSISKIQIDLNEQKSDLNSLNNLVNDTKQNLEIFRTEISKDLEQVKRVLGF